MGTEIRKRVIATTSLVLFLAVSPGKAEDNLSSRQLLRAVGQKNVGAEQPTDKDDSVKGGQPAREEETVVTWSKPRILHFPKDRSVGELYIRDSDFVRNKEDNEWEYFAKARGSAKIPAGKQVRLLVSLPAAWRDLSPLSTLRPDDLYRLGIYGSFSGGLRPDDECTQHIAALIGLKELDLRFTDITGRGLRAMHALQFLECLILWGGIDDAGLAEVAKLKSLRKLDCLGDKVTDAGLRHLAKLPLLDELGLGGAQITDRGLVNIAKLPRLRHLVLDGNFTDAGLIHLQNAPSLKILDIKGLQNITDAGLEQLADIATLEHVNLYWNRNITDKGVAYLKKLPALRELNINFSKVADEGLAHLKQVKTLESLVLPDNDITDKGLADLAQLSQLKKLDVGGDISDVGVGHLAKLTKLKNLHICGKDITDEGVRQIAELTELRELDMSGCPGLTEEGIRQLARLPNLSDLDIDGCPKLDDNALPELAKIKGLKKLGLSFADTGMTVSSLARLNCLSNLKELDIRDINLGSNALDISGLTEIERLTIYIGEKKAFTDRDLDCLTNLKNLKNLQLNPHKFTDSGVAKLAGLTNMENLVIGGPNMTDEALSYLSNMKKLSGLTISEADITDKGIKHLENLDVLIYLQITSNCDISPGALDRLRNKVLNIRVSKNWEVQEKPKVGHKAPDFKFTTMNGKTIELADFKGKVVLLCFWAIWCRPCVASTPALKRFYEDMSQYNDFEMISISLDDTEQAARKHIREHNLSWPQGCVGLNSKIAAEYGIENRAPFYFLIDPDGKIISTRGNLKMLAAKIEEVVGPKEANFWPRRRRNLSNRERPPYPRER